MIKLSTKGRYALRFMIDLATNMQSKEHISMKDVSKRQKISFKYLWLVIHPLLSAGLIESVRGAGGGYRLAKASNAITIHDIIKAVEGDLNLVECVSEQSKCKIKKYCVAREVWCGATKALTDYLKSVTLHDVATKWQGRVAVPEI